MVLINILVFKKNNGKTPIYSVKSVVRFGICMWRKVKIKISILLVIFEKKSFLRKPFIIKEISLKKIFFEGNFIIFNWVSGSFSEKKAVLDSIFKNRFF